MKDTRVIGLLAGLVTITLWASLPVLRNLVDLPPLLTGAVAMASAALMAQWVEHWRGIGSSRPALVDLPFWIMGVGGLTGALYFYFLALGEGDPARVSLVTYTWPLGFVLVADKLAGRGLNGRAVLGALVAFIGVAPLVLAAEQGVSTSPLAYGAGLAAGLCWILFSLYLKDERRSAGVGYKYLFACAALVALLLHTLLEAPATGATGRDWLIAALIGVGPYGLAFLSWGFALHRSPVSVLGILTFFVPILSSFYMILLGWVPLSGQLVVALVAVLASGALTQASGSKAKRRAGGGPEHHAGPGGASIHQQRHGPVPLS